MDCETEVISALKMDDAVVVRHILRHPRSSVPRPVMLRSAVLGGEWHEYANLVAGMQVVEIQEGARHEDASAVSVQDTRRIAIQVSPVVEAAATVLDHELELIAELPELH